MNYTIDRNNFALLPEAMTLLTGEYTLSANGWSVGVQGIQIPLQVFQLNTINIPPADMSIWADNGVYASGEDVRPEMSYITFRCDTAPSVDLTFTVIQTPLSRIGDYEGMGNTLTKYIGAGGDITIPRGVAVIGNNAFENAAVHDVEFPDIGLQEIGTGAFKGCSQMTTMTFYEPVLITADMFEGCAAVYDVDFNVLDNSWEYSADLSFTEILTVDCLTKIINKLYDYSGGASHLLTIGASNRSRLTEAQLNAAVAKNWLVV